MIGRKQSIARSTSRTVTGVGKHEHQRRKVVDKSTGVGGIFVGRVLSVVALVFCVPVGVLFVSVATGAVGIMLGVVGYTLGARRLGALAVVLCTAAMFLGLLVGQGAMPGSYDAVLDGIKETIQDPLAGR